MNLCLEAPLASLPLSYLESPIAIKLGPPDCQLTNSVDDDGYLHWAFPAHKTLLGGNDEDQEGIHEGMCLLILYAPIEVIYLHQPISQLEEHHILMQ